MKDEMDILKEVGVTAAAHGSTALSEILGKKINLYLPSVDIITYTDINQKISMGGIVIALKTEILSGFKGNVLFLLEEKNAYKLIDMCYKTSLEAKKGSVYTEMGMSLIKEVGNIITFAYLSALGYFLKKLIIPSLPILINAPFEEIVKIITLGYDKSSQLLVVETVFEEAKENIRGNFWLVLAFQAAEEIKQACKKILEGLESK
jgi:chemotaxis protein CheC